MPPRRRRPTPPEPVEEIPVLEEPVQEVPFGPIDSVWNLDDSEPEPDHLHPTNTQAAVRTAFHVPGLLLRKIQDDIGSWNAPASMVDSVRTQGVIEPIIVKAVDAESYDSPWNSAARYMVIDGRRRVAAANDVLESEGIEPEDRSISAIVLHHRVTDTQVEAMRLTLNLVRNENRRQTTESVQQLTLAGLSEQDISSALSIDQRIVRRSTWLLQQNSYMRQLYESGSITLRVLQAFSRRTHSEQAQYAHELATGQMSFTQLNEVLFGTPPEQTTFIAPAPPAPTSAPLGSALDAALRRVQQSLGQGNITSAASAEPTITPTPAQVTQPVRTGPSFDVRVGERVAIATAAANRPAGEAVTVEIHMPMIEHGYSSRQVVGTTGTLEVSRTGERAYTVKLIPTNPRYGIFGIMQRGVGAEEWSIGGFKFITKEEHDRQLRAANGFRPSTVPLSSVDSASTVGKRRETAKTGAGYYVTHESRRISEGRSQARVVDIDDGEIGYFTVAHDQNGSGHYKTFLSSDQFVAVLRNGSIPGSDGITTPVSDALYRSVEVAMKKAAEVGNYTPTQQATNQQTHIERERHEQILRDAMLQRSTTVEGLVADESWGSITALFGRINEALGEVAGRMPIDLRDEVDRLTTVMSSARQLAAVVATKVAEREHPVPAGDIVVTDAIPTAATPEDAPEATDASGRALSAT